MKNIIPNGTKVVTAEGKLPGRTIGICIRGQEPNVSIEYHVALWVNGERKSPWLYDYEIEVSQTQSKPAGFKPPPPEAPSVRQITPG